MKKNLFIFIFLAFIGYNLQAMDDNKTDSKQGDRALTLCNFPECTQRPTRYKVTCTCGVKYCSKACKRKGEKSSLDTEYNKIIYSHKYYCNKILYLKKETNKKQLNINFNNFISRRAKTFQEYKIINNYVIALSKRISYKKRRYLNYEFNQKPIVYGKYLDPKQILAFIYKEHSNNSTNEILHKCIVCFNDAKKRCMCKSASYCSTKCQAIDWNKHRATCIYKERCNACEKQKEDNKVCNGCKKIWYCCRECQKKDWPQHKKNCKPKPEKK